MENQVQQPNNEGIVIVPPLERNKDPYHVGYSSNDVLKLEICKLQQSKDDIISCLEYQQKNLIKDELIFEYSSIVVLVVVLILTLIIWRSCK